MAYDAKLKKEYDIFIEKTYRLRKNALQIYCL